MKYLLVFIIFSTFIAQTNAQNTVSIQGDLASSDSDLYLKCDQSIRTIEVKVLDNSYNLVSGKVVSATVGTSTVSLIGTSKRNYRC